MTVSNKTKVCVIVGASHAGVNLAFALRNEGWEGEIILFDSDPALPYHRPPLSKAYLTSDHRIDQYLLRSADSYIKESITLRLGVSVDCINRSEKSVKLNDGTVQAYDKLVLATGARSIIPPIKGVENAINLYPLRTATDVENIRHAINSSKTRRVAIIGGGYIGLETAASLRKLEAAVTILELEPRVLSRVTALEMSNFFQDLHAQNGVEVLTSKKVVSIDTEDGVNTVICFDGTTYQADLVVLGVGIRVNAELAREAGLEVENGIRVDSMARTSDEDVYSIGDCTLHHNPHYDRFIRLESVQNAVDQSKVAAAAICGKNKIYDTIPWFWSDQYDIKLQMVGLSSGYNEVIMRYEVGQGPKFSVWYFRGDELIAVDAVNNAKAYVLGTKFIKEHKKVDKSKLIDVSVEFKPTNLLVE